MTFKTLEKSVVTDKELRTISIKVEEVYECRHAYGKTLILVMQ